LEIFVSLSKILRSSINYKKIETYLCVVGIDESILSVGYRLDDHGTVVQFQAGERKLE
jgi:hypothetical protein